MISAKDYIYVRGKYPRYKFSRKEIVDVDLEFDNMIIPYNNEHSLLMKGRRPNLKFDNKGKSDELSIVLWNMIQKPEYSINNIDEIKDMAGEVIDQYDNQFPNGEGMSNIDTTRYITAHSSSSFLGIQKPEKSNYSYDSMIKTLEAHSNPDIINKSWLLDNLDDLVSHNFINSDIMNREYGDICMNAKLSSASTPGFANYREYVFIKTLDQVIEDMKSEDYVIFPGTRVDRRGKYRLICSFPASIRIADYLSNNGSYELCDIEGLYSKYTTEGYDSLQMWNELAKMSYRYDYSMICIDYKGYDTQISMREYLDISRHINSSRMNDLTFRSYFDPFVKWMNQPKSLSMKSVNGYEMLMPYYRTLASGLHGTHSFENLIGISTFRQMRKEGIDAINFWTNGDDQNTLVKTTDVPKVMDFLNKYFKISWEKSLIGHKLAVWGKLWFSEKYHPMWEIGTFRSIWEKEGSDNTIVEESKFMTNYCKLIQVIITLRRSGVEEKLIEDFCIILANEIEPNVLLFKIPKELSNAYNIKASSKTDNRSFSGLESQKSYLKSITFDLKLWTMSNYYDMLHSMIAKKIIFDMNIDDIKYYDEGTILRIESGIDYGTIDKRNVPFMFEKLVKKKMVTKEQRLVQDILRGTKSYEGVSFETYSFSNIFQLAEVLDQRNKISWDRLVRSNQNMELI